MKNNTKLIMETWRRFLKEGPEGIGADGMVLDPDVDVDSSLPPVEDSDLEGAFADHESPYYDEDPEAHDPERAYGKDAYRDYRGDADYDMDDMGEFNPYDSSPMLHSDDDGLVPAGEDSIGTYYTDDETYETDGDSLNPDIAGDSGSFG